MIALPALGNKPIARAVLAASCDMMGWRSAGAPALATKSIEAIGVDRSLGDCSPVAGRRGRIAMMRCHAGAALTTVRREPGLSVQDHPGLV